MQRKRVLFTLQTPKILHLSLSSARHRAADLCRSVFCEYVKTDRARCLSLDSTGFSSYSVKELENKKHNTQQQIYQNMHHLEVFRFFLSIKITAAHQVRMSLHLLQSEHEDDTCVKYRMEREDHK